MNNICITQVAATVCCLLGAVPDPGMVPPIREVTEGFGACDRVFLYNPDAIAQWIYETYREEFSPAVKRTSLVLPMCSVVPPVTPVCFGSMYSGLQPKEHGIVKYKKPVLKCSTLFDVLPAQGYRTAIVSTARDSISMIFLNRNVDYYIYPEKDECNRKALELIEQDEYACIVLYNGDYDYWMHRVTPTGKRAVRALKENIATWLELSAAIEKHWQGHRTALAFAPDHGCHNSFPKPGNHGKEIEKDMNIVHLWKLIEQ